MQRAALVERRKISRGSREWVALVQAVETKVLERAADPEELEQHPVCCAAATAEIQRLQHRLGPQPVAAVKIRAQKLEGLVEYLSACFAGRWDGKRYLWKIVVTRSEDVSCWQSFKTRVRTFFRRAGGRTASSTCVRELVKGI